MFLVFGDQTIYLKMMEMEEVCFKLIILEKNNCFKHEIIRTIQYKFFLKNSISGILNHNITTDFKMYSTILDLNLVVRNS